MPYNHHHQQQQFIPFAQSNGYQLAAIPHQQVQVQVSQPYSYVTSAPTDAGKVSSIKINLRHFSFHISCLTIDWTYTNEQCSDEQCISSTTTNFQ